MKLFVFSCAALVWIPPAALAQVDPETLCARTAAQAAPPRAHRLAMAARGEHAAFGGQALDAEGRMTRAGAQEAADAPGLRREAAPWQRVMAYWHAVDPARQRLPYLVRHGALRPADRGLVAQALNQAAEGRLAGLGVGPDQGLTAAELHAARTALDRVAVIDTPWSAAFVSWLARQAGLSEHEFRFSEAHADYAGAAVQSTLAEQAGRPTLQALRACDLARTAPRVGDLVCHARAGDAGLDRFDALAAVLARRPARGAPLAMHCDVVTAVDATGFNAVGGNVLQSVTLRRLDFAPATRLLDPSYRPGACEPGGAGCIDRHMSREPWSLLLQWREPPAAPVAPAR